MKTLPNGVTIFNATPHAIRFWAEGWEEPVEVETDTIINSHAHEEVVDVLEIPPAIPNTNQRDMEEGMTIVTLVRPVWLGDDEGRLIAEGALLDGADIVVGSIIAAQCYNNVCGMTPAPGYERMPPAEKRMNPYKFTTF